jgi:hypothetical protein
MRKLTKAEIIHLLTLLEERRLEGSYYGVREHYYKRTDRLIEYFDKYFEELRNSKPKPIELEESK